MRKRLMSTLLAAGCVLSTAAAAYAQTAPQGDATRGRGMFSGQGGGALCQMCHGPQGQGGFGPDLGAARGLTFEQFKRAVQNPWGIMPRFPLLTDQGLADIYAFVKTLTPPANPPTAWNVELPAAGAPKGQILMTSFGCAQCHGPEIGHPRRDLGARNDDFERFKAIVYDHAPATMGQFSRERMSEPVLKEIWDYMTVSGLRALVFGAFAPGVASGANTTYTITLENRGASGKGLAADDMKLTVVIPSGLTVVSGSAGYQGTQSAEYVSNPGQLLPFKMLNPTPNVQRVTGAVAVWKLPKLAAGEKQTLTLTVSGTGADKANFSGTTLTWSKPEVKRLPNVVVKDLRLAEKGDIIYAPSMEFLLPPTPPAARP
jgi:uncharacterized repeat protein (TIGR01451 family)